MRRTGLLVVVALAVALGLVARHASAASAVLPLSVNGQAKSTDTTNFFIDFPANPVYTDWTPTSTPLKEQRAVLEFNLAGLPDGVTIQSADLLFDVSLYESTTNGSVTLNPSVTFWSYAGNNAINVSDATQTSNALATVTIDDLGAWSVPLNMSRIQSLHNANAAAVGVLSYANSQDLTVGIWTATGSGINAPRISVTYVPEPSGILLAGVAGVALVRRGRRGVVRAD